MVFLGYISRNWHKLISCSWLEILGLFCMPINLSRIQTRSRLLGNIFCRTGTRFIFVCRVQWLPYFNGIKSSAVSRSFVSLVSSDLSFSRDSGSASTPSSSWASSGKPTLSSTVSSLNPNSACPFFHGWFASSVELHLEYKHIPLF